MNFFQKTNSALGTQRKDHGKNDCSKKNERQSKKVRFSGQCALHRFNSNVESFDDIWHTSQEYKVIKTRCNETIRLMKQGLLPMGPLYEYKGKQERSSPSAIQQRRAAFHCTRGLEARALFSKGEYCQHRMKSILAVLMEQERFEVGQEGTALAVDSIAKAYIASGASLSRDNARAMGEFDEASVKEDLYGNAECSDESTVSSAMHVDDCSTICSVDSSERRQLDDSPAPLSQRVQRRTKSCMKSPNSLRPECTVLTWQLTKY